MMLGMSLSVFTTFHVVLSLIGIVSGLLMLFAMLGGRYAAGMVGLFLATTVATSVTGFLFPFTNFLPSHAVGIISLVFLAASLLALYGRRLAGIWRPVYVIGAVVALYLNVFVGVVQAFQKVPFLHELAPTQSEPPFAVAQTVVLVLFVLAGVLAVRRFHPH